MLFLQFQFSQELRDSLNEFEASREILDTYADSPQPWMGQLRRHALVTTVHHSTAIEGNPLSWRQVDTALRGGRVKASPESVREVTNYEAAMEYAIRQSQIEPFVYTEDIIKTIHYLLSRDLPGGYGPGQYCQFQNYVIDRRSGRRLYQPPSHQEIPLLMADLVHWLNEVTSKDLPKPLKSALAHLNLVAIHPFGDGNGRAARILASLVMLRGGYRSLELVSLEEYLGHYTQEYYRALRDSLGPRFGAKHDVTPWIALYLKSLLDQTRASVARVRRWEKFHRFLAKELADEGLSNRQIWELAYAAIGGYLTNRDIRAILEWSVPTVTKDLQGLVLRGLVLSQGRGRGVYYVPSARLRQLAARFEEYEQLVEEMEQVVTEAIKA